MHPSIQIRLGQDQIVSIGAWDCTPSFPGSVSSEPVCIVSVVQDLLQCRVMDKPGFSCLAIGLKQLPSATLCAL